MKQKFLKLLYRYLALCSRYYISRTHIQVIAITGSVGKTSCRMVVAEVLQKLSSEKKIYTSPKNYNSELGLVFSIFQIEDYHPSIKNLLKISFFVTFQAFFASKKYDILIAEFGIDAPEDMDHLLRIASPDIAVLTKLDAVHSANFPNGVEGYWQEKWKLLFAARKKVYLNLQDDFSQKNISFLKYYGEIFGKDTPEAHLFLDASQIAKWKFEYR